MATVLITGGAGFIGSYIARELLAKGEEVVLYDAFIQYVSPLENQYCTHLKERFKGIEDKITIIRGDIRNKNELRRTILKYKPECIIHLAALPLADLADTHSEEALESILHGTVNLLDILRDARFVKRFVYASSSMIYGDFLFHPADEEHPKNPKDIYGGTKLAGEILVQSYGRRYEIEYVIVRPSAVYGPTDVNRRVSQIFVENALRGEKLVLHNGGYSRLDFTYVKDLAQGFVLATYKPEAKNEVFNITRGEGRSLREYAQILQDLLPGVTIIEQPATVFRPERGALDITKARKLLGYEPQYSLEEGLREYVEYFKKIIF
jgi:nucleoside-diphosphate-sugar epimerase